MSIVGGPTPYREALAARVAERGWRVVADPPSGRGGDAGAGETSSAGSNGATVAVHYCDSEAAWARLAESVGAGHLGCVAVIMRLDPVLYRRALVMGAGVVHHDTSTEIMAQVVESAGHGEALLPMPVARQLAAAADDDASGAAALDELEVELLRGVVGGETVLALGQRFHFSERTIRRRLQSVYFKLGVDDRVGAIRVVERDGLLE